MSINTNYSMDDLQKLRTEYSGLSGKRAFHGWKEEELKRKINHLRGDNEEEDEEDEEDEMEEQRRREAHEINTRQHITVHEIVPVYRDGSPYAIIGNKYIPWNEAQILMKKRQIQVLQHELEQLQAEIQKPLTT